MAAVTDFDKMLEQYHAALGEFAQGRPESAKNLMSHRADGTIANPYGPPVRGWDNVARTMENAASVLREGEMDFEVMSKCVTPELAYVLELERFRAKVGGRADITPFALRATIIFRPEGGSWKAVHRHADPIVTAQLADSVLQKERP